MSYTPTALLYARDDSLRSRVQAFLGSSVTLRNVSDGAELRSRVERSEPCLLLVDLRQPDALEVLAGITAEHDDAVAIAIGIPSSYVMLEAGKLPLFAIQDLDATRESFQATVNQARRHLDLLLQREILEEEAETRTVEPPRPVTEEDGARRHHVLRHFSRVARHMENPQALLESVVEGVSFSTMVLRVGIYLCEPGNDAFTYRTGLHCLKDLEGDRYHLDDPFVEWMRTNASILTRAHLPSISPPAARVLVRRSLDHLGADYVLPLQAHGNLIGWLLLGSRQLGLPADAAFVEDLMMIGEYVATTVENTQLYRAVAVQKIEAEALLQTIHTGIVATDDHGRVRWYNGAAERILETPAAEVFEHGPAMLGAQLCDLLLRAAEGDLTDEQGEEWQDAQTGKTLLAQTHCLRHEDRILGGMAVIQDLTVERILRERQEQTDRKSFWVQLAASMSHEIRNPLVAIKTFAQLLPQRYEDKEFRDEFSKVVEREVDTLNGIIDKINRFANPEPLCFVPLDPVALARAALQRARLVGPDADQVSVQLNAEEDLPSLAGDHDALEECLFHLLVNAFEALAGRRNPRLEIAVRLQGALRAHRTLVITIRDNGPGIAGKAAGESDRFSPFFTTKATGLGLGLAVAKRTIIDHDGQIELDSGADGTCVTITLPLRADRTAPQAATSGVTSDDEPRS